MSRRTAATQVQSRPKVALLNRGGQPFDFKLWLSALLSHKNHQSAFKRALFKDTHTHFMSATKHAAAYAHGLAVQPTIDLTPREPAHLTSVQLAEALPRMVGLLPGSTQQKAKLLEALETDYRLVE